MKRQIKNAKYHIKYFTISKKQKPVTGADSANIGKRTTWTPLLLLKQTAAAGEGCVDVVILMRKETQQKVNRGKTEITATKGICSTHLAVLTSSPHTH